MPVIQNIYLAANAVTITGNVSGHLQIVGLADDGEFYEIEVQSPAILGQPWAVFASGDRLHAENTPNIADPDRYAIVELDLLGQVADDVWNVIINASQSIDAARLPYLIDFNSNTFVNGVLKFVGIDIFDYVTQATPDDVAFFPGLYANGAADRADYVVEYEVFGTAGDNVMVGGIWNDTLFGLDGGDRLIGGVGSDTLSGGLGDDHLICGAGADIIDGGEGWDAASYVDAEEGVTIDFNMAQFVEAHRDGLPQRGALWCGPKPSP